MTDTTLFLHHFVLEPNLEKTVGTVRSIMKEHNWSHLPLVSENTWIGNLSLTAIEDLAADLSLDTLSPYFLDFKVYVDTSWPIVWEHFILHETNIMPVISDSGTLLGVFNKDDFSTLWEHVSAFTERGHTLILQKGSKDYSFSQISQLVESRNAKLLFLFLLETDATDCQIALKTNGVHLAEIIQDLRRFEYEILSFHEDDYYQNKLADNASYLQKFLNL